MALATTLNFSNTTPTPPTEQQNIEWQNDGGTPVCNESAYDPVMVGDNGSSGGGLAGNVPAPPAGSAVAGKFLKADGTWEIPPGGSSPEMIGDTGGSGGGEGGVVPAPPAGSAAAGKFLKADATWEVPSGGSGGLPTGSGNEVVATPADGSSAPAALRALVPADLPVATTGALGVVKPDGSTITISGGVISAAGGGGSSAGVIHTGIGAPTPGTPATVAHVQSATSPNSGTQAFGSNVTAGNLLLVLQVGEAGMADNLPPTDTVGTVYKLAQYLAAASTICAAVWYGVAPASGANTVNWDISGITNPATSVSEFSGAAALVDGLGTPVYNGASPVSTTVAATLAGDLILGYLALLWGNGIGVTYTAGTGFTLATSSAGGALENPLAAEYDLAGTLGANTVASSFTVNTGDRSCFSAIAFYAKQTGTPGSDGDFYLNTSTGILYGPRVGGVYVPAALPPTLVGDSGSGGVAGIVPAPPAGAAAAGKYLKADGTFQTPPSAAPGAMIQIAKVTVGSGGQASIDFSSIPNTYSHLMLILSGRGVSVSIDYAKLTFNGDAGSNYNWGVLYPSPSSGPGDYSTNAQTAIQAGTINDNSAAPRAALIKALIANYANTGFYKTVFIDNAFGGALMATGQIAAGEWMSVAAINEITLTPSSGLNFAEGTVATLYGIE
jgi:hypothetical protein